MGVRMCVSLGEQWDGMCAWCVMMVRVLMGVMCVVTGILVSRLLDDTTSCNTSSNRRTFAMKADWLTRLEREYVHTLLKEAIEHVKMRDMKSCVAFIQHALSYRPNATSMLRPEVITKFAKDGFPLLRRMLNRHAGFKTLPSPLRGKALHNRASELGLQERTNTVRVDRHTISEECIYALPRIKMKMREEIGKQCKTVLMIKKKRKQCVQGIKAHAIASGVADITRVRRDFHASTKAMWEVSLVAIAAVAAIKDVYVLDMHSMTCLFHYPIFKQVLDLLTHSHIFAINMGEDANIFDRRHFELLASKIGDGTCPVRRWFVESHPTRRVIWAELGLVRHNAHLDKPNIWTLARREDKRKWSEGVRDETRLAWLLAPQSAYTVAKQYNIQMQHSTCNWRTACAARADVIAGPRLLPLPTIAALPQIQT